MGFGFLGVIGVKLVVLDWVVLSLVGDGGFGQNFLMFVIVVELNFGIVWLIMNNNVFGMIVGL